MANYISLLHIYLLGTLYLYHFIIVHLLGIFIVDICLLYITYYIVYIYIISTLSSVTSGKRKTMKLVVSDPGSEKVDFNLNNIQYIYKYILVRTEKALRSEPKTENG